jgi:hypothetical protein
MRLRIGDDPGTFTDENVSIWEYRDVINEKLEGACQQLSLDLYSIVQEAVRGMHS